MTTFIVSGALLLLLLIRAYSQKKNKDQKIIHVDTTQCTGCGACLKKCHRKVLTRVFVENGSHVEVQNVDNCTVCGDCVRVCKFNALLMLDKSIKR